jgi:hypothetical protein
LATASGYSTDEPITYRRDPWWVFPAFTVVAYLAFIVYATFRVFEPLIAHADVASYPLYYVADNGHFHYASPFGTPDFTHFVPSFLYAVPFLALAVRSPAFLILPFPALFRFTCYYYRKSYYRAFLGKPAACAVPASKGVFYKGERGLLMLQNLHRCFLFAAIVVTLFLLWDALRSIFTPNGLYFGIGSALMLVNVAFLMFYTFGCHSFRHLVGGKLDCYSCDGIARYRYGLWSKVTMLNGRHAMWAWLSLLTVAGTDLYIRYVVMGGGNPADPTHFATTLFGVNI